MMGIIIITVVCCAVCTSVIWVVIIYQTRKIPPPDTEINQPEEMQSEYTERMNNFGDDTSSCKDSGTGDSAKRSNDDLIPTDEYTLIINGI